MSTPDHPMWQRVVDHEVAAVEHVEQMRTAITDNDLALVITHVDGALHALHLLRQAAESQTDAAGTEKETT